MFFGTGTTSSVMQAAGAPGGGLSACPNVVVELVNTNARTPAASASLSRFSVPVMLGRPRAGEPVEHGDHQRVALPARGERFAQPGRSQLVPVRPWSTYMRSALTPRLASASRWASG